MVYASGAGHLISDLDRRKSAKVTTERSRNCDVPANAICMRVHLRRQNLITFANRKAFGAVFLSNYCQDRILAKQQDRVEKLVSVHIL